MKDYFLSSPQPSGSGEQIPENFGMWRGLTLMKKNSWISGGTIISGQNWLRIAQNLSNEKEDFADYQLFRGTTTTSVFTRWLRCTYICRVFMGCVGHLAIFFRDATAGIVRTDRHCTCFGAVFFYLRRFYPFKSRCLAKNYCYG